MINLKELDQSTWSCYSLQNNSYYYGQVGYLDQSGIVHTKQNQQALNNPKNKLVKHGYGVYLYNINPQTQSPQQKYIGQWDKDQKSGKGQLTLLNGTIYQGQFHQGHYHGNGKITWPSQDSYEGIWKRSKMDGSGVFKQSSTNTTLKGLFKNNYFIDGNILQNPFLTQKQYAQYKKERKQVIKQKQKQQKVKYGYVKKLSNKGEIKEFIQKSVKSNRVPMILSSKTINYNLQKAVNDLQAIYESQKVNLMDLRKLYILQNEEKQNYRQQVHEIFRQSLINGQIFLISMDDSEVQFTQMFYPDIKEFYQSNGFNNLAWSQSQLMKNETKKRILNGQNINENFKLIIWTKYKVQNDQKEDRIQDLLVMRFQKILPIVKIDFLVVNQENQLHKENS